MLETSCKAPMKRVGLRVGLTLGLLSAAALAVPAAANDATPRVAIEVRVEQEQVRRDDRGREIVERNPVTTAQPGDLLVYTLRAANTGEGPALNPRIEDPIPRGTVLVPDAFEDSGRPSEASLDGGRTWQPFPAVVTVDDGQGKPRLVPASPETYTHLRWVLAGPLMPGDTREVSFKVRVD